MPSPLVTVFRSPRGAAGVLLAAGLTNTVAAAATLPPIVVTAGRVAESVDETLTPVTVITREEIEERQAQSVRELLRSVPGLTTSNSGGPGKATSVYLRGTESDQVLVLIDGVKVGSATLGSVSFQDIPVALIERIEVVRGPRSSLYGSEAIGGVIQIFTRKGKGPIKPHFSVGGGRYDTRNVSAGLSGGGERAWASVDVSAEETDGFDACHDNVAAGCYAMEPDDDGYSNRSGSLRAGYRFANGVAADFHWLLTTGEAEFDGGFQNESETEQRVVGGSVALSPTDSWHTTLSLGRSEDESDNFLNGTFSSRFDTRRDSASWQNDFAVAPDQRLTVGIDWQREEVDGTTAYVVTSRDNQALFTQYRGAFGAHDLELSLRRDDNEQFGGHTTGAVAWGRMLSRDLRLTASYGTAFKAPTFNELYWPADPFWGGGGNPNLRPETSRSIEIGLSGPMGTGRWSLNVYETRIDDHIALDALFVPQNIDQARIRGLEAGLATHLAGWEVAPSLTLLAPENRGNGPNAGNLLPRRAEQTLHVDVARTFGDYRVGAALHAVGRRYDDLANNRELDEYATVDLRAERPLAQGWLVQAEVTNLFDKEYETAAFFNQPGRSLFVTLRYRP